MGARGAALCSAHLILDEVRRHTTVQFAQIIRGGVLARGGLAELDSRSKDAGDILGGRVILHLPVEPVGRILHDAILEEFG